MKKIAIVVVATILVFVLLEFPPSKHVRAADEKAPGDRPATVTVYNFNGQIIKEWKDVSITFDTDFRTNFRTPSGEAINVKGGILITTYK